MSSDERSFLQTGELLRQKAPLIHCITNPISINACANVILSAGARPMMAEHPAEAAIVLQAAAGDNERIAEKL